MESYISLLILFTPPRLAILRIAGLAGGECCISFGYRSAVVEDGRTDSLDIVLEDFAVTASEDTDAVAGSASDDGIERGWHDDSGSERRVIKTGMRIC